MKCFNDHIAPRCASCGAVIDGEYISHNKKNYHTRCFTDNVAVKCTLCGLAVSGAYTKDFWGNNYHGTHKKKYPPCDYCTRLISKVITGGGQRYKDGRRICNICARDVVSTLSEGKRIMADALQKLRGFGIIIEHKTPLHLVDSRELARISGKRRIDYNHLGFTRRQTRFVNNVVTDSRIDILMLTGLPRSHFISTAAHELMHVWQYLNVKKKHPMDLTEGSCNYASYLILKPMKTPEAEFLIHSMMTGKDKIYGKGFRKIRDMVKRKGMKFWLKYLRN